MRSVVDLDLDLDLERDLQVDLPAGRAGTCEADDAGMFALQIGKGWILEIGLDEAGVSSLLVRRGSLPKCAR